VSQNDQIGRGPRVAASVTHEGESRAIVIEAGSESQELFVRGAPGASPRSADAAAVLALPAAMSAGIPVTMEQPVSTRLLSGIEMVQRAFVAWQPGLQRVPLEGRPRQEPAPGASRGVAAFFSGGVDSFYTLLECRDQVTDLIFVHGFDIGLEETDLRRRAAGMAADVAAEHGLRLIEVETDIRRAVNPPLPWGSGHGVVLAAIGLCLQEVAERVLIPASYTFADMFPWGTHPLLDPLWSTEATTFEHHGFGIDRMEKIARISSSESAMVHLRVCWENRDGHYNCCRCEKCLRTMISLQAVGALERSHSFPEPLDPRAVAALPLAGQAAQAFARQNLVELERNGRTPELAAALRQAMRRSSGLLGLPRRVGLKARYARNRLRR
jgi:hypothetical protein